MHYDGKRVTNGHRACVAGLVIAGVGLLQAAAIAGVSYRHVKASLPAGWHTPRLGVRVKWTPERLKPVRKAWNSDVPLWQSAIRLRTTVAMMKYLARREKWPKRPRAPRRPTSIGGMSPEMKRLYIKLRRELPRSEALREVLTP
jgi:hypothetical protein